MLTIVSHATEIYKQKQKTKQVTAQTDHTHTINDLKKQQQQQQHLHVESFWNEFCDEMLHRTDAFHINSH